MNDVTAQRFSGTMPVAERHRFDVIALQAWMRVYVAGFDDGGRPLAVEQFKGGQSNPTFRLSAGEQHYVMRRKPPGKLLSSAHAVDREYRVITALQGTAVPVAKTFGLCEDDVIIGTPFYVMEWVDGRVLWDPALPGQAPATRAAIFDEMNRVIAALHTVDPAAVGLADFGKPGNYFARQIDRWSKQYRASETTQIPAMDRLMDWLPAHIPPGEESAIVHGDYRLDNQIFDHRQPKMLAVLDWELSTIGHPLADFAYHCMTWHIPTGVFRGLGGANLPELGIPSEAEYVKRYCERTGRGPIDPSHWDFCMAYNLFRLAAILQGIAGRVKDGTAASAQAVEMGKAAAPLAELAWQQVEKIQRR